ACLGKWHLGGEAFAPEKQGFDFSIGGPQAGTRPTFFFPYRTARTPNYRLKGVEDGRPGEYLTDRLTTEAEKFIEANKDRPFFLFFPHFAVHIPLSGKPELIEKYKKIASSRRRSASVGEREKSEFALVQSNAIYAAVLESL